MRGEDERCDGLFSYVDLEVRVPADHPLRAIRVLVDEALAALSADFALLYSTTGRPSIAPEKLLRALLLQAFYTIRSERQLMEQLDYNPLFRWFVGLSMDAPVWDSDDLFEEPRPSGCGGCGGTLSSGGSARRAGSPAVVGRALLGRRHADRGVGVDEELPPQGRRRRPARRAQRGARLPRRAALERDPCVHHGCRCPAVPQGRGPVEPAVLHGPLYERLPGHKDRFRCDGRADCSFVSGLSMRD